MLSSGAGYDPQSIGFRHLIKQGCAPRRIPVSLVPPGRTEGGPLMALMDLLVRPFVGEPVHLYPGSEICTDTHSRLNDTRIRGRLQPTSVDDVVRFIGSVRERGESMSVAGACH